MGVRKLKDKILSVLSLFTSTGTLICCALPALLVSLGMAAVVVSAVSLFPWLIPLTRHKAWLFFGAGVLIALNFYLVYRPKKQLACDIEAGPSHCEVADNWNRSVLWLAVGIYAVGAFMAYLALPILKWLEG